MEATAQPATGRTDSLGVLRHRWWIVALGTLLGLAAGTGFMLAQEPVWESTTSVLVHPAGQDTNVVGGRTQGEVNLDTEAQLVRSTAVAAGAAALLAPAEPVAPDELARRVTVEVPPNTAVLAITYAGSTPQQARTGAQAFAEAYLQHRERTARADLTAQVAAIEDKIDELGTSLAEINDQLAGAPAGSATEANLESRRGTVASQLDTLTGRLDELTTATVTAGTVISEAPLPDTPSRPQPAIVLASGAALGLVLGVTGAGAADRLARRVHRPADLHRRLGVPVLASLGRTTAPDPDEIASPYGPGGRAVDRLRNEVVAMLAPAPGEGRVIVVTGVGTGTATSLAAANLAASLARCGQDTVLVGAQTAHGTAGGTLTSLLGIAPAPGLSEVLAGRAPVAQALQQSPRHPRLQVMTMGATATAAGLLQSPALRTTLARLAAQARYVVVDAPAATASADAQGLASHAHAALLVVEQRRARLAAVADAVDQLCQVRTPLLGAVLVPPRRPAPDREPARATRAAARSPDPGPVSGTEPEPESESEPGSGLDQATITMPVIQPAAADREPVPAAGSGGADDDEPPGWRAAAG